MSREIGAQARLKMHNQIPNHTDTMWTEKENGLEATFVFPDFVRAFAFMTEVAFQAEKQHHHPDWSNTWNRVHIRLTTHDAGGVVTEKDRTLARAIGDIYAAYQTQA